MNRLGNVFVPFVRPESEREKQRADTPIDNHKAILVPVITTGWDIKSYIYLFRVLDNVTHGPWIAGD
jgi:hypothetical protein